mgnify:CR=1 FL=1
MVRPITRFVAVGVAVMALAAGCSPARRAEEAARIAADSARADSIARARQDSINRAQPGYVIDSILPPEEEARRFRAAVGGSPVARYQGGAAARDSLVAKFLAALSAADPAALHAMAMTAREFIDLYYPTSAYSHPPYRESPSMAWRLMQDRSEAGIRQLVQRYAGRTIVLVAVKCEPKTTREGQNNLHTGCLLDLREGAGPMVTRRLFGSIVERDGQFKFVSYINRS